MLEIDGLYEKNRKGEEGILKMKATRLLPLTEYLGTYSLYQISLDKYLDSIIIAAFAHFHPLILSLLTQVLFCL